MLLLFYYIIHSFCGLADSQVRLLMLTARKSDLEFQINRIIQQRMVLTQQAKTSSQNQLYSLQSMDRQLEFQLRQIETQYQMVKTEQESIKKIVRDSAKKDFKYA